MRRMEDLEEGVKQLEASIATTRARKAQLEKEMNDGGAYLVKLHQNRRLRKTKREIEEVEEQISKMDMEEAFKARRNFDDKFRAEKERETQLHSKVSDEF